MIETKVVNKKILISNFSFEEEPVGGSELENNFLMKEFNIGFLKSKEVKSFSKDIFYIISNVSLIPLKLLETLLSCNYIIIEHDYSKITRNKFVWQYQDCIIPDDDKYCLGLYSNAKAVFFQTTDHMNTYLKNGYKGNFINLKSGLWSYEDLNIFKNLFESKKNKINRYIIFDSSGYPKNDIKNVVGAMKFCESNKLDFTLLPRLPRPEFLNTMANYKGIVFLPLARESLCRLMVEARCLGLDVITTKNYGASLEPWFKMSGIDLINFLEKQNKINIEKIKEYIGD